MEKEKIPEQKCPQLVCENCGYKNQLYFNVRLEWALLTEVMCVNCNKNAYWTFYFETAREMIISFLLRQHCQPYQKIFVTQKFGRRYGRKKAQSKSI